MSAHLGTMMSNEDLMRKIANSSPEEWTLDDLEQIERYAESIGFDLASANPLLTKEALAERRKIFAENKDPVRRKLMLQAHIKRIQDRAAEWLKRGDVVKLISGGPQMTVVCIDKESGEFGTAHLLFFDHNLSLTKIDLPIDLLTKIYS